MSNLNEPLAIYVTRHTAHGETYEYNLPLGMTALAIVLIWMNVVVWSVIGLWQAVRLVAG